MHLLDTTTKELKTFYGETIPEYAILSHMWGREEDEVLFRHIAGSDADKREGKQRKGYAKIEGACNQAIEDGWEYIWIDTCCIDKTSSAELSEAINSMFEWYWKSEVCYVYLEDVVSGGDGKAKSNENTRFPIVPFERSRWFTRGWTLQELIAPQIVVFYSKDWVDIGTKASLQKRISDVTRIRVEMLLWYDPEKASVAEKISWAALRKTTRAEDVAYCLMGLLGVNMPLLYGEGDRAFRRLQEELMKVSDDDSLFAWKSSFDNYVDYLEDSRGMLANSPWEFRDGANIKRSDDGAYSPYSMTNQGLRIKLPLLPIDPQLNIDSENTFKTILKCAIRHQQPTRRIIIYFEKTPGGYYQRLFSHWLDETETPLNETELTTLLVPQAGTLMARNRSSTRNIEVKILPTESGFTVDGHTLTEGYKFKYNPNLDSQTYNKVVFEYKKKKPFEVVIGLDKGTPWLDFNDDIDEFKRLFNNPYWERGSCAHLREQHLDRLCEKILGGDWWLTVSMKRINNIQRGPHFRAVINIQRDQAKGQYIPPAISISDNVSGDFLDDLDHLHLDFKRESYDWVAVFNPRVKSVLGVDLVYRRTILHGPSNNYRSLSNLTLTCPSKTYIVQFSRDGKYFAIYTDPGGIIQVYDMETSAIILEEFKKTTICSICFSPDGKFVTTGDVDSYIDLWDIGAKRIHKSLLGNQPANSLCFSFDGHLLIAGLEDTIQIWGIDSDTSRILTIRPDYEEHITSIAVSPNDDLVAAGSSDGIICVWDIETTQLLEDSLKHGDDVSDIAFTPDGGGLVSGSANGTLKYWDTSRLVFKAQKFDKLKSDFDWVSIMMTSSKGGMTFTGHKEPVTSVAVSHDGRWVISGSTDGCVLFWDLSNATAQFILKTQPGWISPLFNTSPAGSTTFATFDRGNGRVRIWDYYNIQDR